MTKYPEISDISVVTDTISIYRKNRYLKCRYDTDTDQWRIWKVTLGGRGAERRVAKRRGSSVRREGDWVWGGGNPSSSGEGEGSGEGARPPPPNFFYISELKWCVLVHFTRKNSDTIGLEKLALFSLCVVVVK